MKLRIQANTIRLRLSQQEVQQFKERGRIEEVIRFGAARRLVYAVQASDTVEAPVARYEGDAVTVLVPAATVPEWAAGDQVEWKGMQADGAEDVLQVVVEKDLKCLHRESSEDDAHRFPHPRARTN